MDFLSFIVLNLFVVTWSNLVFINLSLTIIVDRFSDNLTAIGFKNLIGSHLEFLSILNRLLMADSSADCSTWPILDNCLRLEGLGEFGSLGQFLNLFHLWLVFVVMVLPGAQQLSEKLDIVIKELRVGPEEICEDVLGVVRKQLSTKLDVIVVSSPENVTQMAISFIDLNKLLLSFSVSGVCTRVILDRQLPVGLLEVSETGSFRDAQDLVIVRFPIGIVLIKELLLLFFLDPVLSEELLKDPFGIVHAELLVLDDIIVVFLGGV